MKSQVLKAVLHGDSLIFTEHPELLDSLVRVYFHSSLQKYNKMECWGPLRDAIEVSFTLASSAFRIIENEKLIGNFP